MSRDSYINPFDAERIAEHVLSNEYQTDDLLSDHYIRLANAYLTSRDRDIDLTRENSALRFEAIKSARLMLLATATIKALRDELAMFQARATCEQAMRDTGCPEPSTTLDDLRKIGAV